MMLKHYENLLIADAIAAKSKDPRTKVGALLVGAQGEGGPWGYNGLPRGIPEPPERWQRPAKYARVCHAEANALIAAARTGWPTLGAGLVVTMYTCAECAKLIIQAGIRYVVTRTSNCARWAESHALATEMLGEAGIAIITVEEL